MTSLPVTSYYVVTFNVFPVEIKDADSPLIFNVPKKQDYAKNSTSQTYSLPYRMQGFDYNCGLSGSVAVIFESFSVF